MRSKSLAICCLAVALPAAAQVFWSCDFETPYQPFASESLSYIFHEGYPPSPSLNILELGPPHGQVHQVVVDSSNVAQFPWSCDLDFFPWSGTSPAVVYDPRHTFFKFDLAVSQLRPFHIKLQFNGAGFMNLDADVSPTVTNTFQAIIVPLTAFTQTVYLTSSLGFPQFPTGLDLGIHGDPNLPATTWPSAPDNWFMVDNIAYIISPPLTLQALGSSLALSWPTNTPGFVLQQSPAPMGGGGLEFGHKRVHHDQRREPSASPGGGFPRLLSPGVHSVAPPSWPHRSTTRV